MKTMVIKVGGALLGCEAGMDRLFVTLKGLSEAGWQAVLVHGGGALVEQQLKANGFSSHKLNGLRVTPEVQMDVVAGALAGSANTQLVAKAIAAGLTPVGLSLADGGLTQAQVLAPELGAVGKVAAGKPALLEGLLAQGMLPIISSIAVDAEGQRLNVNADQAATVICQLLGAELTLLSDVSGVLDGKGQLIPHLDPALAAELTRQGVIEGGMKVKVDAALDAARSINNRVLVASWRYPEQLAALVKGEPVGTQVHP
ncbi:acetylglutamate kinase [Ferrimonas balearica]|uniref:acetylglutamate kinase n=1 Tax=Ferrimonas balearica TaxID=44012 RepID=UPI001C99992F|nr:acetylglutamate kinase [Ferrimonas balearica]MBY5992085.1 acetylglutamate kinase [Ferrimonas balearica]